MEEKIDSKIFYKNFFILLSYYLGAFIVLQSFAYLFLNSNWLLTRRAFLSADAEHYYYISQHGYEGFRVAFFPLFPFLWKITGDGVLLITIINSIVFLLSFSALTALFKIKKPIELLLLASIPCLMFMFIAYTEALFFLFGTMLLIGLKKNMPVLVCLGILFCGLTRPSATVFLPAILFTVYLSQTSIKKKVIQGILFSLSALLGLGTTLIIQHSYTGKWFSFFEEQKGWGNELRIPELPFKSWAGGQIVRLDATALLVGFFALVILIKILFQKIKKQKIELAPEIIFSISYLAGIALLILAFRGGSFFSLNRFVYATPFFTVALVHFIRSYSFTLGQIGIFFFVSSLFWLLFGSYVHIQYLLKFELMSLFLAGYFLLNNQNKNLRQAATITIFSVNTILLMYFYYRYLINDWVG